MPGARQTAVGSALGTVVQVTLAPVIDSSMIFIVVGASGPSGIAINLPVDSAGTAYLNIEPGTFQSKAFYSIGTGSGAGFRNSAQPITITVTVQGADRVNVIAAEFPDVTGIPLLDAEYAFSTVSPVSTGSYNLAASSPVRYNLIVSYAWTMNAVNYVPGASPTQDPEVFVGGAGTLALADTIILNQTSGSVPVVSSWTPGGHVGQFVFQLPDSASTPPTPPPTPPGGGGPGGGTGPGTGSDLAGSCANPPQGQVGVAYSHSLTSSGGTAPRQYFLVSGSLPHGLSLNSATGAITGTPSGLPGGGPSTNGEIGLFYINVVDATGTFVQIICSILILPSTTPDPTPPVGALALTCGSPPGGVVGTAYSHTFVATGGSLPYAYAITVGALPTGLSLSAGGVVSGTPSAVGTFSFTVQVTDGAAATATAACTVGVVAADAGGGTGGSGPSGGARPAGGIGTWLRGTRPGDDHGWMLDAYAPAGPISRSSEVTATADLPLQAVHDKLIGIGGSLYLFTGENDAGDPITLTMEGALDDADDDRANKLWGDSILEIVTNKASIGSSDLFLTLVGDPIAGGQPTGFTGFVAQPVPNTGGTKSLQIWSPNQFNRTLGFRITGAIDGYNPEFYSFQPSWVLQPETVGQRIGDWSDDGKPGNKLIRGCVIEADTAYASGTDLVVQADLVTVSSASRPFVSGDVGSHLAVLSTSPWLPDLYVILSVSAGSAILDHAAATTSVSAGTFALGNAKSFQVQGDGGTVRATINVSHPGQSEAPYFWAPFESHEYRLVAMDSADYRQWKVRLIYDDYPEFGVQIEDFVHLAQPMYVRGFELEASTLGQLVSFQFQSDLGVVQATAQIQTSVRDILAFGFPTPFVCSEYRVVPLGSWEKFNLRLIGDTYPDFAAITTQHLFPAGGRPAHIRGFNLRGDTGGSPISLRMLGDGGLVQTFTVNQSGQSIPVPYVLGIPATVKIVQFVPSGAWRFWEILWDAEEYPELTTERTKVISLGGCRRVQGARITADSGGQFTQFEVHGDQEVLQLTTAPTVFTGKVSVAFPRANEWPPFFAHNVYLVPLSPVRTWTDEIEWISEPAPDLATPYQTPPVTVGSSWWTQLRIWVGHISTSDITLTIDADGNVETYTIPNGGGRYARSQVIVTDRKARWRIYCLSSPEPFRLYLQDSFVLVKEWGRPYDKFSPLQVFGDRSLDSGARI